MLDTIIFRIHDLKLHQTLCEFLNQKNKPSGLTILESQGNEVFNESVKRLHKTFLVYHDSGTMLEKAHFNKLKSNHYQISYQIDYLRDFIVFNVSIPKYYFGTNILHFNLPPNHKKFNFSAFSSLEKNLAVSFKLL